ncbi:unnamed protein product [Diplocarpon coronariae]
MSIPKLEIVKAYLINNFNKGFIKASFALYAALVLFVKKANSSLRFYINYHMLNNLTLPAKLNYIIYDKEMLAIIRSFGYFKAKLARASY